MTPNATLAAMHIGEGFPQNDLMIFSILNKALDQKKKLKKFVIALNTT